MTLRGAPGILAAVSHERAALYHLGWVELCEHLGRLLFTPMAQEALAAGLARALEDEETVRAATRTSFAAERSVDPAAVRARLEDLDALESLLSAAGEEAGGALGGLGAALARLVDVRAAAERARHGAGLGADELLPIRDLLAAVDLFFTLRGEVASGEGPLGAMAAAMERLPALFTALDRAIARGPDGAAEVVDGASPALARARQRAREVRARLVKEAAQLLRSRELEEGLQDRFWTEREGRVVVPIRADAYGRGIGEGIIHGASASGGTLFVEPTALIAANNEVRAAQVAALAEERRVLERLSRAVGEAADAISRDQDALVAIDAIQARLRLSRAIGGVRPEVVAADAGARLELSGMRHPLLTLGGVTVVPNDLSLACGSALVISGPNAGGKTVALKTAGLCVLLAQAGIRAPTARPATIPLYRALVTDVGDDQSILANLSTFSAHIGHVRDALECARRDGPGTLVLLDEIAVGTDPGQGAALAEAILLHLTAAGATVVTTTHYERLKLLAGALPGRFVNAAVGFDLGRMAPTFRLTLGVPGPSSAFAVARRLGLPEAVLADAEARVEEEARALDALLLEVNAERESLAERGRALTAAEAEAQRRVEAAREREAAALAKARTRKERAYDEAAIELRALRQEVQSLRRQLRAAGAEPEAIAAGVEAERALRARLHERREPAPRPSGEAPAEVAVGERVRIVALDREGEVVAAQGEKVVVQVGGVRTSVARAAIRRVEAAAPAPRAKVQRGRAEPVRRWEGSSAARHFGDEPAPMVRSVDNCADVRGERAEEALRRLDRFLDGALQAGQEVVLVLHGHGSGALRQAVREHLRGLGFVRRQRPGLAEEGGEGVTVAWLG